MIVGYARTSTAEQVAGLDAQVRDLKDAGAEKVFQERVSSVAKRGQLDQAIDYCRDGDTLMVTKLDRLARSITDLCNIVEALAKKGVALKVIAMDLDTSTATGKLLLNLMGALAQFEREIMLERQREGIAKAKAEGKYKGRAPTAKSKSTEVVDAYKRGLSMTEIAIETGVSRPSVYRILNYLGLRSTA